MDAIEKRARELLAAEYTKAGFQGAADDASREQSSPHCEVTIRAIIAALTPPDGYVLVNHTQLRQLLRDTVTASDFVGGRAQSKTLARRLADQAWALIETPAGALRAEVTGA